MEESSKKHIAILGSTGSIGTQALEVIEAHRDEFVVEVLTANRNADLLAEQALRYSPNAVVINDESAYPALKDRLFDEGIKVYCGPDALADVVQMEEIDIVLTALVGFSGLKPTLKAIEAGKHIALANKETLVVAGELVTKAAKDNGVNIYPVDSEHSAIFQCIVGEFHNKLERVILTASGGPFRGKTREELVSVTKKEALKHPNWDMGAKVTIDSASLMNKGLEVIEAKWLFGLQPENIDVVVHPQSIIHSMAEFQDGSIKAQMGYPDMKLPIQFALSYPLRLKSDFPRFNFADYPQLTFEKPDKNTFRNLQLAFDSMAIGGTAPCILNAANEIAVESFLKDEIGFLEMSEVVENSLSSIPIIERPTLEDYFRTDEEVRAKSQEYIKSKVV